MEHVVAQRGGDADPLKWVLPLRDRTYQEALLQRASSPGTYSRLDGLYGSLGLVFVALDRTFDGARTSFCCPLAADCASASWFYDTYGIVDFKHV